MSEYGFSHNPYFPCKDQIENSALIQENTSQRKSLPDIFDAVVNSISFSFKPYFLNITKKNLANFCWVH